MYYTLKENVYLVSGYINACMYDLNTAKLYHINKELYEFLDRIIDNEIHSSEFGLDEKNMLENMITLELLEIAVSPKEVKEKFLFKEPSIEFAWIEVTTKCNLKCIHCYEEADEDRTEEMSIDDFSKVISQLQDLGVKRIQIIGGEPFVLGGKLKQMIEIASQSFHSVEIFTNGTIINPDWVSILKRHSIQVALSVYSYNASEHDKVTCVQGSQKRTNYAIKLLKENGIKYRVCNVLMNNIDIGINNTSLYTLSDEKDIVRLSGRASMKLLNKNLIRKKLITQDVFAKPINIHLFRRMQKGHNCFANRIYIATDLTVYPCVMERRFLHGIMQDMNLKDTLNTDILSLDKNKISGCKDCEYRYACFDCRPNSLGNNIFEKPWYCTYNPYTGMWTDIEKFITSLYN